MVQNRVQFWALALNGVEHSVLLPWSQMVGWFVGASNCEVRLATKLGPTDQLFNKTFE
jgi:hypothetical protein